MFNFILPLIRLTGAFLNRVRGGLRNPETGNKFPMNKLWQPIIFGLCVCLFVSPWYISLFSAGISMYAYAQIAGWGEFRGAIAGAKKDERETNIISKFIYRVIRCINNDRLWGVAGLSLRCGIGSILLALGCWSLPVAFVGFFIPLVTLLAEKLADLFENTYKIQLPKLGWNIAEWLEGFFLWGWIFKCLV